MKGLRRFFSSSSAQPDVPKDYLLQLVLYSDNPARFIRKYAYGLSAYGVVSRRDPSQFEFTEDVGLAAAYKTSDLGISIDDATVKSWPRVFDFSKDVSVDQIAQSLPFMIHIQQTDNRQPEKSVQFRCLGLVESPWFIGLGDADDRWVVYNKDVIHNALPKNPLSVNGSFKYIMKAPIRALNSIDAALKLAHIKQFQARIPALPVPYEEIADYDNVMKDFNDFVLRDRIELKTFAYLDTETNSSSSLTSVYKPEPLLQRQEPVALHALAYDYIRGRWHSLETGKVPEFNAGQAAPVQTLTFHLIGDFLAVKDLFVRRYQKLEDAYMEQFKAKQPSIFKRAGQFVGRHKGKIAAVGGGIALAALIAANASRIGSLFGSGAAENVDAAALAAAEEAARAAAEQAAKTALNVYTPTANTGGSNLVLSGLAGALGLGGGIYAGRKYRQNREAEQQAAIAKAKLDEEKRRKLQALKRQERALVDSGVRRHRREERPLVRFAAQEGKRHVSEPALRTPIRRETRDGRARRGVNDKIRRERPPRPRQRATPKRTVSERSVPRRTRASSKSLRNGRGRR